MIRSSVAEVIVRAAEAGAFDEGGVFVYEDAPPGHAHEKEAVRNIMERVSQIVDLYEAELLHAVWLAIVASIKARNRTSMSVDAAKAYLPNSFRERFPSGPVRTLESSTPSERSAKVKK